MKKSIAVLLVAGIVLASFFSASLSVLATSPEKLRSTSTAAPASWDNQGTILTVTQVTLNSDEELYSAGYTTVSKYVYSGSTGSKEYMKQLSPKRGVTTVDISSSRDTTYLRAFVRVPVDTRIKFWLSTNWVSKDSVEVNVDAVANGSGYSEVVFSLSDCTHTDSFKEIFVGLADYEEAATVKEIYISTVEVWSGEPEAVLTPEAAAAEPEWLASTNSYVQIEANSNTQYPLSFSTKNSGNAYNTYWRNSGECVYNEFSFASSEYQAAYYSQSDAKREIRFAFSDKTAACVSQSLITDGKIDLSKLPSTAAISVLINVPVNMKLAIGFYTSDYNRYLKEVSVYATDENDGWQRIVIPVSSFKTGWGAKILGSIIVRPVYEAANMPDATLFGYGDKLLIARPQLTDNAASTLSDELAADTVEFGKEYMGVSNYYENQSSEKFTIGTVNDMSGVDAAVTQAGYTQLKKVTINATFYDVAYDRNSTALSFASFKDNNSTDVDNASLIQNGCVRFFVKSPRDVTLNVYLLNGWSSQSTVAVDVTAGAYQEVIIRYADIPRTAQVTRVMIGPDSTTFANKTLQTGDVIYYTPVHILKDLAVSSFTSDNTITAEQTNDANGAENGFTGLRKLTVEDDGFYELSDADRAVTHTLDTAVKQADVDYLGFWVKAPKAMRLSLTLTDSYGAAVTADVAVSPTLKRDGYRFVTVPRSELGLNYLYDIVSITLTPAATAEAFLDDGEELLYSAFALYSGKPVSFYASYKIGDANGDGVFDIRDLVRSKKVLVGIEASYTYAIDTVEDGLVSLADIRESMYNLIGN